MSVIYGELNAVDQHRTIHTLVPKNVELTREQYNELLSVEKAHTKTGFRNTTQRLFATTENPGLWFFALENPEYLINLSPNPSISEEVIFLAVRKLISNLEAPTYTTAYFRFMNNTVTHKNTNLLKFLMSQLAEKIKYDEIIYSVLGTMNSRTVTAPTPMDVCVWLMEEIRDNNISPKRADDVSTVHMFYSCIEMRKAEFLSWLAHHEDDVYRSLAPLPYSWVIGFFGKN